MFYRLQSYILYALESAIIHFVCPTQYNLTFCRILQTYILYVLPVIIVILYVLEISIILLYSSTSTIIHFVCFTIMHFVCVTNYDHTFLYFLTF